MKQVKVTPPDWDLEQLQRFDYLIGADEVGRGPVAGPIYAAAVRMQMSDIMNFMGRVTDSKAMTEKQRLMAFPLCQQCTHSITWRPAAFINQHGIQPANEQIFVEAIQALLLPDTLVVVDGTIKLGMSCTMLVLPRAETISLTVAIASVLAKVTRDSYMAQVHLLYPQYDWGQNKGYGTPKHIAGLRQHGVTPEHRTMFVNTLLSTSKKT
jgi:ribonuclease HII